MLPLCVVFCFGKNGLASWPTFPLSAHCNPGSAVGTQSSAWVARGAQNLLVVWVDERISTRKDIFCTRISPSGEVLDPIGIPVCTTSAVQNWVSVAGGDQVYLVVWTDSRNGNYGIYGARVDAYGNLLDPEGIAISTGSGWAGFPDAAWDGDNFLVAWSHDKYTPTSYDIYATRVTTAGEVLDPRGIQISSDSVMELYASVAYNGSTYFVVWEHALG